MFTTSTMASLNDNDAKNKILDDHPLRYPLEHNTSNDYSNVWHPEYLNFCFPKKSNEFYREIPFSTEYCLWHCNSIIAWNNVLGGSSRTISISQVYIFLRIIYRFVQVPFPESFVSEYEQLSTIPRAVNSYFYSNWKYSKIIQWYLLIYNQRTLK